MSRGLTRLRELGDNSHVDFERRHQYNDVNLPLVNEYEEQLQNRPRDSASWNRHPPSQLRMQQIVTSQNQDQSFRDVRQILDEDEALPIN